MRIAITILAFATFTCISHTEAFWFDTGDKTIDNLGQAISDNINKATNALQDELNKIKDQTDQALEKLQEAAHEVENTVNGAVNNVVQSVDEQVNQVTEAVQSDIVDVTECKKIVGTIREAAKAIVKSTTSCVTDAFDKAKGTVTNIFTNVIDKLTKIQELKNKAKKCPNNYGNIFERIAAISCLTSVNTNTAWYVTTVVPSIVKNIALSTKEITALPPTLTSCIAKNAIGTLTEQSVKIIGNVKQCVAQKIGKLSTEKMQEFIGGDKGADKNPLNWIKKKIF